MRVPPKTFLSGQPAEFHCAQWSSYVSSNIEALFDSYQGFKPADLPIHNAGSALSELRTTVLEQVNTVDRLIAECKLSISRPCPDACPGYATTPSPPTKSLSDAGTQTTQAPAPPKPAASRTKPTPRPTPNPRTTPVPPSQPSQAVLPPPASAGLPPRPKGPVPGHKPGAPAVANPVRLVIRFGGNPPQALRNAPQPGLFRKISSMLDVHPTHKDVAILGAHWNKSNNIIVSFPPGTPDATLTDLCPDIRNALGLAESVVMSIDKRWTKLLVSSVPARLSKDAPVFSEADAATSLARNPAMSNIVTPRQPRWIRHPSKITGAHSSIVLTVEDPDGSVARRLLKTSLFIFGAP
ncbi:hypothetical protein FRC11_001275, partial [Ceratobasidium sp. 423]